MARRKTERNRTNKNNNTVSQQKARANAAVDGRGGRLAAYTGGARTAKPFRNSRGYEISELEGQKNAWNTGSRVDTYTRTANGRLSANGRNTTDAYTNSMTPKNDDGSPILNEKGEVRQSGRSKKANRSQRTYDVKAGMNNITQKAMDAMIRAGLVREVNGSLIGDGGNVIRRRKDGNYTMGLSNG